MASRRAALTLFNSSIRIAARQPRALIVRRLAAAATETEYERASCTYSGSAALASAVAILSASAAYSSSKDDDLSLTATFQKCRKILRLDQTKNLPNHVTVDWDAPPLGAGAFASVHLAYDTAANNEPVALKRINKEKTNPTTFAREVNALMQIQRQGGHPHIMKLRDMFEDGDYFYLVTDFAQGGEVFEDLACNGAYSEADAASMIHQLAQALDFLHNAVGMVHADLKPENLLLTGEARSQMVLVDFGCAAPTAASSGCHGSGTTAYSSPERLVEDEPVVTPAMDMWGVGIILYMLLSQMHPFDPDATATDEEVVDAVRRATAPPNPEGFPASVQDLLNGLLAVDPAQRMTATEVLQHPWILQHMHRIQEESKVKAPKQSGCSDPAGFLSTLRIQSELLE